MESGTHSVALKRVYETPEASDGTRVLVERLWPRGLSKENAHVDLWLKEIAPSHALRKWYGHDPARFAEFRRRYEAELTAEPAHSALAELFELGDCRCYHQAIAAQPPMSAARNTLATHGGKRWQYPPSRSSSGR